MAAFINKRELRQVMRQRRRACDPRLGFRMADHLLRSGLLGDGTLIAGYWPIGTEIDIRPALETLVARGNRVVLPVTPRQPAALQFREWRPGSQLSPGRVGTAVPDGAVLSPDIILLPLLAFDRKGGRLGYGGGYYDRTLAALPEALAIGCGYALQEVDSIPRETHDRRMDAIATEAGVLRME